MPIQDIKLNLLIKILSLRFIKGFIGGAISAMVVLTSFNGGDLDDLGLWLAKLGFAATIGGISGGINALGKFLRLKGVNIPI